MSSTPKKRTPRKAATRAAAVLKAAAKSELEGDIEAEAESSRSPAPDASGTSSRKRRKSMTDEDKKKAAALAEEKKKKKEKRERLRKHKASLVPWTYDRKFKFPRDTPKLWKGEAMKQYKLNNQELATLPHETTYSNKGFKMYLYSVPQLQALAKQKHGDIPDSARGYEYRENGTIVRVLPGEEKYLKEKTEAWKAELKARETARARAEALEVLNPTNQAQLQKCLEVYFPEYNEEMPEGYVLPQLGSSKGEGGIPEGYTNRPGRRVTELEAMNLFLLRRYELQDLKREKDLTGILNNTLDYAEVQQRAMDSHGGFDAHNNMILLKTEAVLKHRGTSGPRYPEYLIEQLAVSTYIARCGVRCYPPPDKEPQFLEVWYPPHIFFWEWDDFVPPIEIMCAPGHCGAEDDTKSLRNECPGTDNHRRYLRWYEEDEMW